MKATYHYICALLLASVALVLGSCSEEDAYERAPQVAEGVTRAYFPASNTSDVIISPQEYAEKPTDTVKVYRHNASGQVTVPVIVDYADSVFQFPASVTFADGDSVADMVVALNNLKMYKEYKYSVHLDESYTNPYLKEDEGSYKFNYKVMVSQWEKVIQGACFLFSNGEVPTIYSDIYHLEGVNQFYIENFLGSGINLKFKIIPAGEDGTYSADNFDPNNISTWKGVIVPLSNYYMDYDADYDYSYWWLLDDTGDYASWAIEGHEHGGVSYINFPINESSESYCGIDMNGSTTESAGWSQAYVYYPDGETSGWTYMYIYFDSGDMPADVKEKYDKTKN